jgi:hypothetical protein
MLRADEIVLEALGFALRGVGDLSEPRGQGRLRSAVCRRLLRQLSAQLIGDGLRLDIHLAQERRNDAVSLLDEHQEEMLRLYLSVVALFGEPLRRENRLLRLFGVLVQVHICVVLRLSLFRSGKAVWSG